MSSLIRFAFVVGYCLNFVSPSAADERTWIKNHCPVFACDALQPGAVHLIKSAGNLEFAPSAAMQPVKTSLKGPQCFVYVPNRHDADGGAVLVKRVVWTGVDQQYGADKVFFSRHAKLGRSISNIKYQRYHNSLDFKPLKLFQRLHTSYTAKNGAKERTDDTQRQRQTFRFSKDHQDDTANLEKVTLITYELSGAGNTCLDFVLNTHKSQPVWDRIELTVRDVGPLSIFDVDKQRQFQFRLEHSDSTE